MIRVYNDNEKEELDKGCGPLRLGLVGTVLQEIQEAIIRNEKISIDYNNATGILRILVDNVEKDNVNLLNPHILEEDSTSTATVRRLTIEGVSSYDDLIGRPLWIRSRVNNTTTQTVNMNVNNLGNRTLNANLTISIASDTIYCIIYNGTIFNTVSFAPRPSDVNIAGLVRNTGGTNVAVGIAGVTDVTNFNAVVHVRNNVTPVSFFKTATGCPEGLDGPNDVRIHGTLIGYSAYSAASYATANGGYQILIIPSQDKAYERFVTGAVAEWGNNWREVENIGELKGMPNGIATLDENGLVPDKHLPEFDVNEEINKGLANGVAPLDEKALVPHEYLPNPDILEEDSESVALARRITIEGVNSYDDLTGKLLWIRSSVTNTTTGAMNINVNNLGNRALNSGSVTSLVLGTIYCIVFNGTIFNTVSFVPRASTTNIAGLLRNTGNTNIAVGIRGVTTVTDFNSAAYVNNVVIPVRFYKTANGVPEGLDGADNVYIHGTLVGYAAYSDTSYVAANGAYQMLTIPSQNKVYERFVSGNATTWGNWEPVINATNIDDVVFEKIKNDALPLWSVYETSDENFNPNHSNNNNFSGKWTKVTKTKWLRNDDETILNERLYSVQDSRPGDYYISNVNTPPSTVLGFGTWLQIGNNRHLMATTGTSGDGGSSSLNIGITNLAHHNHHVNSNTLPSISVPAAGNHTHNPGTAADFFYRGSDGIVRFSVQSGSGRSDMLSCPTAISRSNTTDNQGNHTHTIAAGAGSHNHSTDNVGSGTPLANSPLNRGAFMWYRTA